MIAPTGTYRVSCKGCGREDFFYSPAITQLLRDKVIVMKDGTGITRGSYYGNPSEYIPAEYVVQECGDCVKTRLTRPMEVGFEMVLIQDHMQQIVSRGVQIDDAARYAVAGRTIRQEIKRSVPYVTWLISEDREALPDDFKQWAGETEFVDGPARPARPEFDGWVPPAA